MARWSLISKSNSGFSPHVRSRRLLSSSKPSGTSGSGRFGISNSSGRSSASCCVMEFSSGLIAAPSSLLFVIAACFSSPCKAGTDRDSRFCSALASSRC